MREKIKNTNSAGKNKQKGFVLSLEMLLFASLLVAGTITGWVAIRDSVNAELKDAANALESAISFPYFSDPLRGTAPLVFGDLTYPEASPEDPSDVAAPADIL
jgi:hypothetical protein